MGKNRHVALLLLWLLVISLIYLHSTDAFNQDLGRHLKLGEIIWETKQVPKTNLFSYTNPNESVFNSHWGSQVIFYLVHKAVGVNGLIILSVIVNTVAFGMLFTLAVRRVGFAIPSILFIPFAFILLDRTWIRPEMFGNLLYAIVLIALFVKRARDRLKWFFPLVALLWINLHITAVFGVFAMGVVLLQEVLDKLLNYSSREGTIVTESRSKGIWHIRSRQARTIKENVLIFIFILIALLINPYGLNGVLSAFTVLNKYGYTIVENQSWLFLRDFGGFPMVTHITYGFIFLVLSFVLTVTRLRRPHLGEVILLIAISILTLRFVRNEILFAYTAFLTTAFNFGQLRSSFRGASKNCYQAIGVNTLLILASVLLINRSHSARGLPIGFGSKESYKAGVDFFLAKNLEGPIFNNFDIGGYLIYRLYPKDPSTHSTDAQGKQGSGQVVFVDNRPEAYPVSFFEDAYKQMQFNPIVFKQYEEQYNLKTIIWGKRDITPWSYAFLQNIVKESGWKSIYDDGAIIIYTKSP